MILDFTIFCGVSREETANLIQNRRPLAEDLSQIVFENDLLEFSPWWDLNVTQKATEQFSKVPHSSALDIGGLITHNAGAFDKMRKSLLGLWCAENDGFPLIKGTLVDTIIEINKGLKSEEITRKPDGPINREISGAPSVFKDHLGIKCLTKKQKDIFECNKKHILIDGPAGSGKTVVLLGKMLQLAKKEEQSERKVLVVAFGEYSAGTYEKACISASIECRKVALDYDMVNMDILLNWDKQYELPLLHKDDDPVESNSEVNKLKIRHVHKSFSKIPKYKVVILYNLATLPSIVELNTFSEIFDEFPDHHILVDDGQCLFSYNWRIVSTVEIQIFLEHLSSKTIVHNTDAVDNGKYCTAWLVCDLVQFHYNKYRQNFLFVVSRSQTVVEQVEPRRSELCRELMTHFKRSGVKTLKCNLRNSEDFANALFFLREVILKGFSNDIIMPSQDKGHYIHGFKPTIYFLDCDDKLDSLGILKICEDDKLECLSPDHRKMITELQNHEQYNEYFIGDIAESGKTHLGTIPSAEWAAVTAILDTDRTSLESFVTELYLVMSRARVYCTVFVIDSPNFPIHKEVLEFEKELSVYANVKRFTPAACETLMADRMKFIKEKNEVEKIFPDLSVLPLHEIVL